MELAVLVDYRLKMNETENINKYLDLARERNKLWHMNVTEIPIEISALGMVWKGLEEKLEELKIKGRIETIQTTELLR